MRKLPFSSNCSALSIFMMPGWPGKSATPCVKLCRPRAWVTRAETVYPSRFTVRTSCGKARLASFLACAPAVPQSAASASALVRLRQAEDTLGYIAEDELRRNGGDAPDQRLAQPALDVVFLRVAEAAVRHHRLLAGVEARLAGEVFRGVRLGAARLAGVVERRGLEDHQPGRLERHPVRGERMLDALVLADRPVEHHALLRILRGARHG